MQNNPMQYINDQIMSYLLFLKGSVFVKKIKEKEKFL